MSRNTGLRRDYDNDKKEFNIVLNDEDLKTIKKETFRNMIRKAAINISIVASFRRILEIFPATGRSAL